MKKTIPVIDLFAGPGGLCEGFSSVKDEQNNPVFEVKISIEKDPVAHRTLHLRALYRKFLEHKVPDSYYKYIRNEISREEFLAQPDIKEASDKAHEEARCAELGVTPPEEVDSWIKNSIKSSSNWVLIGGPPCQAYSLAGRSRMKNVDPKAFEKDKRHFLYTEYLRIIKQFAPSIFIMENVKGMLNSTHKGNSIFEKIIADLRNPRNGLNYQIRSLVVEGEKLQPNDYVIKAEEFGIPQCRHRVILFGIRSDVAEETPKLRTNPEEFLLKKSKQKISVEKALVGIPPIRSRISRAEDSHQEWLKTLEKTVKSFSNWRSEHRSEVISYVENSIKKAKDITSTGGRFIATKQLQRHSLPEDLRKWLIDERIGGVVQHESRSHMYSDLQRYMFASSYAMVTETSPTLHFFPKKLLPAHINIDRASIPFSDRFRVQLKNEPATTVVAHIQKDGHYYIHFDPAQCRSLSVREAARLQTFPDNYYFEGNRTQQYAQIGNAVPPLLANKIANVIFKLLQNYRGVTV